MISFISLKPDETSKPFLQRVFCVKNEMQFHVNLLLYIETSFVIFHES